MRSGDLATVETPCGARPEPRIRIEPSAKALYLIALEDDPEVRCVR